MKTKMKKRILHSQIHTEVFRSVLASIIIAIGVVSGATALAESPSWPVLNGALNASPEIAAGVGVHTTRVESLEALQFPNTSEITTQVEAQIGEYSDVATGTTVLTKGLTIHATFDSSITGKPNAAAIEAMINRAILRYKSLFSDPITIQIRFRYATTTPNGTPLPAGVAALSLSAPYIPSWSTFINALRADGKTSHDFLANMNLPVSALSPHMVVSSANGRAVGGPTPPYMFANGTLGNGGPYDGIVTLNSALPFQFTRPTNVGKLDAQRFTEHEIDEVMGLGSRLGHTFTDLRPQDLFSWSSAGHRNITSSGPRYFSINGGRTHIVNFNQNPMSDFGDWLSTACPQVHPYVQNAVGCPGQSSDVTATSPEGINLDVIGYDLR